MNKYLKALINIGNALAVATDSEDECEEEFNLLKELVDKEIALSPKNTSNYARCPKCSKMTDRWNGNYCPRCGQKLDWNDAK